MVLTCPKSIRTRERIECKVLGSLCIHQYYKVCKGRYEFTDKAFSCPMAKMEGKNE